MSLVAELRRRNVVRVVAAYLVVGWLLTEVLTTLLPTLGAPEWTSRAVILIFALGFIPAVVFSWFYELTPDGIKREEDVDRENADERGSIRKLDYVTVVAVVVLIVFVGLFSAQQAGDESTTGGEEISEASVAVLPFANMSNDEDNEYFSDGLTETLLHMLAQVPELKVAARTSSFAFKGQNINVQEIAVALGVAHILEGSVQRAGDRVRITAQLIRASDGFHVWSESYDRTLDDIFDVQDEIANKVGVALSASLLGDGGTQVAGVTTTDADAYDLFLQARKARATFSYGGLRAAEDLLKGALLIDPDFLDAKTELAGVYFHQLETGLIDMQDAVAQIAAVSEQVLAVQPDNAVARAFGLVVQGMIDAQAGDISSMSDSMAQLEAIVAEVPDELQPRILLIRTYQSMQQNDKILPVLEEALRNDPLNPAILYEIGTAHLRLEQLDEATASLEKSLEIEPNQPNAYTYLGQISLRQGDGVGYAKNFLKALEVDPKDHELPGILAVFLYQLGLTEQGDDLRERVLALAPTSEVSYRIEMLRAISMGDEEASVASARRAIDEDIDDRRFAWGGAIQFLLRHATRNGTVDEEVQWLSERSPGMFDIEADSAPQKHRVAHWMALSAWYTTMPREELLARMDAMIALVREMGFEPEQDPMTHVNILAMRGEIEQAVEVALDRLFTQSVATNLNWRDNFAQQHLAQVVEDSRVQGAMQRWEEEEEALRSSVQSYLADLQAAS